MHTVKPKQCIEFITMTDVIQRPVLHTIIHDPVESEAAASVSEDEWQSQDDSEEEDGYFSVGSDDALEEEWSEAECAEDDSDVEECAYVPRPSKRRKRSEICTSLGGRGGSSIMNPLGVVECEHLT